MVIADGEDYSRCLTGLSNQAQPRQKARALERALDAVLEIPQFDRALVAVALHLTGANRNRAMIEVLRAAEAIDEPDTRSHALAAYLRVAEDKADVAKRARRAMAEELHARWSEQREHVLSFCASEKLFCAPMLSEEAAASLLESAMSIRDDWRWL